VTRLSKRLGLTKQKDAEKIERDLMKLVPREHWNRLEPLAYLAWPPPLLCAQAGLQPVRGFPTLPKRQSFFCAPAKRRSAINWSLSFQRDSAGSTFAGVCSVRVLLFFVVVEIALRVSSAPRQRDLQDRQADFVRL